MASTAITLPIVFALGFGDPTLGDYLAGVFMSSLIGAAFVA